MKSLLLCAVLLMLAGCTQVDTKETAPGSYDSTVPTVQGKHHVEFELIAETPTEKGTGLALLHPCKIYLMTHTSLEPGQDVKVRRRYMTVCYSRNTASYTTSMTEYDIIR